MARSIGAEIRAAIARGALTPDRAAHYLARAVDHPGQAAAVARQVAQLRGPGQGIPGDGAPDAVMTRLWPEADPGELWAAAPDPEDLAEPPEFGPPDPEDALETAEPGHGPVTAEHTHPHASYLDGGVHAHAHVHRGDNRHEPGAGHGHTDKEAGNPAVTAGIRRRTAAAAAAAASAVRVEDLTDQEVLKYMGPPPGGPTARPGRGPARVHPHG